MAKPSDTFNAQIHHLADADLFYTIDRRAEPEEFDWVIVDGRLELYAGQECEGVIRTLDFYALPGGSQQWSPQIKGLESA